ncbi:hypothetical protein HYQ46_012066 [Verticillium longisporum]|nr:hypothetical protein HYQ46_012066 [Verticillium longisporum]
MLGSWAKGSGTTDRNGLIIARSIVGIRGCTKRGVCCLFNPRNARHGGKKKKKKDTCHARQYSLCRVPVLPNSVNIPVRLRPKVVIYLYKSAPAALRSSVLRGL